MEDGRLPIGMTTKKLPSPPTEAYHRKSREKIKEEQRAKVVEYILKHHTPRLPMRYFGLPAERYKTEWALFEAWKRRASFVGVERNWAILEKSVPWMPGRGKGRIYEEEMRNGRLMGYNNHQTRTVNFGCASFLNLGHRDKINKRHRHEFANRYKRWTAFWLDTCATTTGELYDCLLRCSQWCNKDALAVPFAATFILGRDSHYASMLADQEGNPLERRVGLITALLSSRKYRKPVIDSSWDYESAGGIKMGMILGRLIEKVDST